MPSHDLLRNDDGIDPGAPGITASMIYWADVLYDEPLKEGSFESAVAYEIMSLLLCRKGQTHRQPSRFR